MSQGVFWPRTMRIFSAQPVRVTLTGKREIIGDVDVESLTEKSCTIRKADGSSVVVVYSEVLAVEQAVRL